MEFLSSSDNLDSAVAGSYDVPMVIVSVLIASIGSYSAFAFSERLRSAHTLKVKWGWLICGALSLGSGIWAMHFVGMLAYELPFNVTYDAFITGLSVTPAVLAGGVALYITSHSSIHYRNILFGGLCMGSGIGAMHYTGMTAMHMPAMMRYNPILVIMSVLVAVVLAMIALYLEARVVNQNSDSNSGIRKLVTALVMGMAISGMHYTAMTATYFFSDDNILPKALELSRTMLAALVVSVALALIAVLYAAAAIGARLEAAEQLAKAQDDLINAIETISDGFVIFDKQGQLLITNSVFQSLDPQIKHIFEPGKSYEDFLRAWISRQNTIPENLTVDDYVRQHSQVLFKQGFSDQERHIGDRWLHIKERATNGRGLVAVWSDITHYKEIQNQLEQMAHYDNLTGLANRYLFNDQLQQAIARAKRNKQQVALLYIDLDGFKPINDSLGHEAGDIALKEVSQRLKTCVRASDTIARLGGDEFAVIAESTLAWATASEIAQRIIARLSKPIDMINTQRSVGASIGISIYPIDADDIDTLIKNADAAMYEVKKKGRNHFQFADQFADQL